MYLSPADRLFILQIQNVRKGQQVGHGGDSGRGHQVAARIEAELHQADIRGKAQRAEQQRVAVGLRTLGDQFGADVATGARAQVEYTHNGHTERGFADQNWMDQA